MSEWKNLSVINIKDFVKVSKKISHRFMVTAIYDLGIDLDMEQRGISVNTQDPLILENLRKRLAEIEGIEVTHIETIPNKDDKEVA